MEAGVQTVLLSVLDTHRREDYVVSQLIKIANLASKDEHLATICTAAVQLKTATSLLWVARRSAVAIVHPERLEAFDAADRRGALDDEEDEEDDEEEGGRAAGGAPGVETMEMPLAGSSDGAVVHNRDLRKVDPMQLCQQALGLLSVWAEDPDFSQAVATEVGEACVELYRTFDEAKQHALQYAVLRVMARVAGTQPACVALVKVQGVPEILGQFCWDQDRMLTDKVSSKAVELTGALSGASFQGASLLVEAGVNWVVEALALRYAILGEDAPYAACGAVLESLYTGEARFRKLARNKRSSGGARRLQLAAVLEDLTEEGSEEADGEAEAAEESAEEVPEWQACMVAGIVPFDDFPKGTLAALTSGAELDIWFCPFMHRSGKVKVRTMRVKLDSSLNLIQVLYFSSRQQCDLLWAVALRDATAIRVGAPTHGIKRQIFRRSAKAERSLCIDGPASAAYNRGADGTVQQEAETADEGGEAGKAPITLLHIELSSPDEAVEVRNVLSMVQSFSRCQKAISVAGIKSKLALGGLEDVAGEPEPPVEEAAAQE
ncbi:unnamed protein product [Symbiodinium sp. KB8]|nr:unnamed protein product [Symbiodinium sp. KB8]